MQSVKFLHTADIHLDSPFSTSDVGKSEIRRHELRQSFSDMITYAKNDRTELLLIAGDLFETAFATKETVDFLKREFASIPDCRIVIAPGNHDPFTESGIYSKTSFPENVHIFSSEHLEAIDFPEINCTVYGYAFLSDTLGNCPFSGKHPSERDRINILVGHGDMTDILSEKCPISKADIEKAGFDYTALGHIHNSDGIHQTASGYYAYSGCPTGRGFDETGKKTVICGELFKSGGELKLVPKLLDFSLREYRSDILDITGLGNTVAIIDEIKTLIRERGYSDRTALRVTLNGTIAPELRIYPQYLQKQITGLFLLEIIDRTLPLYDSRMLENDPSIRGALFEKLRPMLESGDPTERETAIMAFRYALIALSGGETNDLV